MERIRGLGYNSRGSSVQVGRYRVLVRNRRASVGIASFCHQSSASRASSHDAQHYTDEVERDLLEAMAHPRCVAWGEMGLDYHYDNSPREIQRQVFSRQLNQAVKLGKPLTIHTREAEEDTERILKERVPQDYRIHIHCFTDSPEFAKRLLDYFPNLYIGITGVITFATNQNTSAVISEMTGSIAREPSVPTDSPSIIPVDPAVQSQVQPEGQLVPGTLAAASSSDDSCLRILLETDAPYMVPANLYQSLPSLNNRQKLPLSHTAMIPWTAEFVANIAGDGWTADRVMIVARENARRVYGV